VVRQERKEDEAVNKKWTGGDVPVLRRNAGGAIRRSKTGVKGKISTQEINVFSQTTSEKGVRTIKGKYPNVGVYWVVKSQGKRKRPQRKTYLPPRLYHRKGPDLTG